MQKMKLKFNDLFSDNSEAYKQFRPTYPQELFAYLSSISKHHQTAWDCATGTGQSAVSLSNYYSKIIATDASASQIKNAEKKQGVVYQIATAENSHIDTGSIDLITVAQAFHWFNVDEFAEEVNRVLKDNGIIAIWTYNLLSIRENLDKEIIYLYKTILGEHWPEERKMVEKGYKNVQLPFTEIKAPSFNLSAHWNLSQLIGYLCTWSATKKYKEKFGTNPVEEVYNNIADAWGDPENVLQIKWLLSIKVWKKT